MASSSNTYLDDSVPEFMYHYVSLNDASNYEKEDSSILKCPFCSCIKKKFYCVDCIQNGNFTHSIPKKGLERFADKKAKEYQIKAEKDDLIEKFQSHLVQKKEAENVRLNIEITKEKIKLLQKSIALCKEETENEKKLIEELLKKKTDTAKTLKYFPEKLPAFHNYREELKTSLEHKRTKLFAEQCALETVKRKRIMELVTYIFPIAKVPSTSSRSQVSPEGQRKAELQEAQTFAYLEGRWSFGNPIDEAYSIVEPHLIISGDFSAYTSWCEKDGLSACRDTPDEKELFEAAFGCSAALQYTAQLVQNITSTFDFHVPRRTSLRHFMDFCQNDYNKNEGFDQFYHHVAKLNANILDLCLARQVDYSKLKPDSTISNLMLIIDPEANERRINTVEEREKFLLPVEENIDKDMLPPTDSDDSMDDIESEFVHVSEEELPESVPMTTSFIATSFQSVTSFWKTATGHK